MAPESELRVALRKLVSANHILHFHAAVDGFGHVSVRNPENPATYFISGYMPPALVTGTQDLIEYNVSDSTPVDSNAPKGYSERYIHGELFRKFPEIHCVIHSHATCVLPFANGATPMVPVVHMTGFLGGEVKIWDIAPLYTEKDQQDMLVNRADLGADLAAQFAPNGSKHAEETVVLMKRHGFTTHGPDIETAVYRALYTMTNAEVQTATTLLQDSAQTGEAVQGLNVRHAQDCKKMTEATQDKAWRLWVREVETQSLYRNEV